MIPLRFSVMTCNLWGNSRWTERKSAIEMLLSTFRPDILSLQELTPDATVLIDQTLSTHARVNDTLPGWNCESNIYWNSDLFKLISYGAEDIGLLELERRLFWVRLKVKSLQKTILVSTAHFTYKAHPAELETGTSPRLKQSHLTVSALKTLAADTEPVFFMGDLNDSSHPAYILSDAGYKDCFSGLGVPCVPTAPCYPTFNPPIGRPRLSQTLDWVFGNQYARNVAAQVPHFYYNGISPSDHWPVVAVYEI